MALLAALHFDGWVMSKQEIEKRIGFRQSVRSLAERWPQPGSNQPCLRLAEQIQKKYITASRTLQPLGRESAPEPAPRVASDSPDELRSLSWSDDPASRPSPQTESGRVGVSAMTTRRQQPLAHSAGAAEPLASAHAAQTSGVYLPQGRDIFNPTPGQPHGEYASSDHGSVERQSLPARSTARAASRNEPWRREIEEKIEPSSHLVLSSRVQDFLTSLLHLRLSAVKIYANPPADALTRQFKADALAYEDKILFRSGQYAPDDPAGLALLGHELTHVAQGAPNPEPVTAEQYRAEEHLALSNEQRVLRQVTPPAAAWSPARTAATPPQVVAAPPPVAQTVPLKTALSSRETATPPPAAAAPEIPLSDRQLRMIKEAVYRDIMARIKTDLERGS